MMARKRKPRRHLVHSLIFGFRDGSVVACAPERKPPANQIEQEGLNIDEDGVIREIHHSISSWHSWDVEQRKDLATTLANRLNTRRAIRELVLPELAELKALLQDVQKRVANAERAIERLNQNRDAG